jgi:ABC-type Mn2+/Zn2+ transport system ATPase subunit
VNAQDEPDTTSDESDTALPEEPGEDAPPESASALITTKGLGVDGEHGPLFSDIDLELTSGFHAIQMPGGPGQHTLLLALAGRLKPSHGTVTVMGDSDPRAIRRHCAIAAFADIDELEETVTVQTVLAEQVRWLAPWFSRVPADTGRDKLAEVFGELPTPSAGTYIVELSDLDLFLLRITLALLSDRPILVIGDLEQVRDNSRRATAVERLGALAANRTIVVGVTNPLGIDAPIHDLHDHRILTGRD